MKVSLLLRRMFGYEAKGYWEGAEISYLKV
jgi:hypothetical protein